MNYKIGFLGAGHVVQNRYLPVIEEDERFNLLAITSHGNESARSLADQFGFTRAFSSSEDLIVNEDLDVVFLCTPTHLHRELGIHTIESEKHLFMEKPIGPTFESSCDLVKQATNSSGITYVSANNNFRPENKWFINEIQNGRIGELELLDFSWFRPLKGRQKSWLYQKSKSGGGALMDLGYHLLHLALTLIPERSSYTVLGSQEFHRDEPDRVEDTFSGFIDLKDGPVIDLNTAWDLPSTEETSVSINALAKDGTLTPSQYDGSSNKGFQGMLDDFYACLEANEDPNLSIPLDTMQLIDDLYESANSGAAVTGEFLSDEIING